MSGVPTPTIKHYMREGLLPGPQKRTSRNMAYYDARLAQRVKVIKELQHGRFLPLKIIADLLEAPPSSAIRADLDAVQRQQLGALEPALRAGSSDARGRRDPMAARTMTRDDVLRDLLVTDSDLRILGELGLVQPSSSTAASTYEGADLDLLEIIDETRRKGLGDLFPLAILEPYAAAIRTLIRVELELFRRQVLAGGMPVSRPVDAIARDATALGERLIVAMRSKLLIPELHDVVAAEPGGGRGSPGSRRQP